jgi:hypothetical protein
VDLHGSSGDGELTDRTSRFKRRKTKVSHTDRRTYFGGPVPSRHRFGSCGSRARLRCSCRVSEGGATFAPPDIREVPAVAVRAKGSEQCDVAYHVDGQRYQLGGCNREYVGEWSKRDGTWARSDLSRRR